MNRHTNRSWVPVTLVAVGLAVVVLGVAGGVPGTDAAGRAQIPPPSDAVGGTEAGTSGSALSNHPVAVCDAAYTANADRFADQEPFDRETNVEPDETVVLVALNSSDATRIAWNDTSTGEWDGPYQATTKNMTMAYSYPAGEYTPRIRVDNYTGAAQVAYTPVGVDSDTCPHLSVAEDASPTADFGWTPSAPAPGRTVTFDGSGSVDPQGTIERYGWDFDGDGTVDRTTSDPTVTHTYATAGTRAVTLTVYTDDYDDRFNQVIGEDGSQESAPTTYASVTREVGVDTRDPVARCSVTPRTIPPEGEVTLDASDSENAESFRYDFDGDGEFDTDLLAAATVDSSRTPGEEYADPGEYEPRVRAYGPDGTTDTAACPPVAVVAENDPPEAAFAVSPRPAVAGERTTLDASASADPDGQIRYYRWDFDGDGTVDRNTTDATVVHRFPHDATAPGYANVVLSVVDDDGAVGVAERDVEIARPDVTARCSASPTEVRPGEEVTLDAGGSTNAEAYEYDVDGDGTVDTDQLGQAATAVTYEQPGEYAPRVRAYGPDRDRSDTARCGPVEVREENEPPVSRFEYAPDGPAAGETTTFDASASTDPDGRVVEYRWDFDGDGTAERTTTGPVVEHTFGSEGNHTVGLVVVDDDGATARSERTVEVGSDGIGGLTPFADPGWPVALLVGGLVGLLVCRGVFPVPIPFGGGGGGGGGVGGVTAYATGSFEVPDEPGAVSVSGLGFEPDLLVFTAATGVSTHGTDGWVHGKAARHDDGSLTQNVVGVATDAGRSAAAGTVGTGRVLDLLGQAGESTAGLAGRVERTTADGFEVAFDAAAPSEGVATGDYTVTYQAFQTPDGAEAVVGHAVTPAEPGVQEVDLGIDANYVTLTATATVGATTVDDGSVGICHGTAVGDGSRQQVQTSTVDPGDVLTNGFATYTDRALHLLDVDDGAVTGRTSARVTGLGETLELTYDEVCRGGGQPVTFVALAAGAEAPELGTVEFPAADADGEQSVVLGRTPGMVSFTACPATRTGTDDVVTGSSLAFGWSHGTALDGADGRVVQQVLQSAVDPGLAGRYARLLTGTAGESAGETAAVAPTARPARSGAVDGTGLPPAVATVDALDAAGTIAGWDELSVTSFGERGFTLAATSVSSPAREPTTERPLVCYTAWPLADEGADP